MADENVNVVYTADTTQYVQSLNEAVGATERYAEMADNAAGKIGKIGITTAKAIQSGFGLRPQTITPAVRTAAAYEQALSLLGARAKIAGQNVTQLGKDVRSVARDFPIGIGGAKEQFQVIQQAGKAGKELSMLTKEMVKLGAATGEIGPDLTQSMVQFTRTFNQFDPGKVENVSDSITKLSATMGVSASTMLDFSNTVAPLSKQLNISATDVLGFSTAFARAGESGARSANVFNTMLQDMERSVRTGAPQVRYYAEALHMTSQEFINLAEQNPTEAMTRFFESITAQGSDGIRILEDLGMEGVRTMKAITQVADTGGIRKTIEEARKAYGSGATEIVAGEAFNGLADSMDKTRESMTQLVEASGKPMLGFMTDMSNLAGKSTSAFADFVSSTPVQVAITAGLLLKGAGTGAGLISSVGQAKLAGGWAAGAIGRGTERALGSPVGQFAAQYRPQIMTAAVGGAAIGAMSGNPMLMLGSMAAYMMLSNAPGFVSKLQSLGSKGFNMFLNDPRQLVPIRQGIMGNQGVVNSWAFNRAAALQQWRVGIDESQRLREGPIRGGWSATRIQALEANIARAQASSTLSSRAQFGRSLGAGAGMIALGAASMLTAPMVMLAGAGGLAYGGYKMYQTAHEAEESSQSELTKFSSATGIATKGMESLNLQMQRLQDSVSTMADAAKVTTSDWNAATNAMYEAALPEKYGRMSPEEAARNVFAQYGYQSPEMMQRVKTDLLSQGRPQAEVQEIMNKVVEYQKEAANPVEIARQINQDNYTFADKVYNNAFGTYFGKTEAIERSRGAATNISQRYSEIQEVQGRAGVIEQIRNEGARQAAISIATNPDVAAAKIEVAALLGTGLEDTQKIVDEWKVVEGVQSSINQGLARDPNFNVGQYATRQTGMFTNKDVIAAAMGMTEEELDSWIVKNNRLPTIDEYLFGPGGPLAGLVEEQKKVELTGGQRAATFAGAGVFSTKDLAEAYALAAETGKTLGQIYQQEKTARAEGAPARLGEAAYLALAAHENPEDVAKRTAAATRIQFDAMSSLADGSEMIGTRIAHTVEAVETVLKAGGELSTADIQPILDMFNGYRAGIEMMTGGELSIGQARGRRQEFNMGLIGQMRREGNAWVPSDQADLAGQQMQALQDMEQIDQEILAERRQFLQSWRQQELQSGYSRQEFGIQAEHARRDAEIQATRARLANAKQEARAREDQARSEAHAWEDYYIQLERLHRDYSKNLQRANEDFTKGMQRGDEDFQRQSVRMWDDYYRSVERSTEDFVANMTDPNSRMAVGRVWSAQGMAANLAEQTQLIQEQFDILDDLRSRGLDQSVIDVLGLADPRNAMQARSLVGSSQADIDALNKQMAARGEIGTRAYEEQLNARRAEEDINLAAQRSQEDYILGVQRATEDFNTNVERMAADFATSLADMYTDLTKSIARAEEELERALARSAVDLEEQLRYMKEDLDRSLADGEASLERSITHSRDMMIAGFEDIALTAESSQAMVNSALDKGYVDFGNSITNRLRDTTSGIRSTVSETTSGITDIVNGANTIINPLIERLGGFASLMQALGILSNTATYGPQGAEAYYGRSSGAGSAAASGTGNNPNAMAARFEDEVGNTKMYTKKHGYWDVYQACLKNVGNEWEDMGNSVKRYPTAISKALMLDKTAMMNHNYNAPRGALFWWKNSPFGHVSVSDGAGNAINNYGGKSVERTPVRGMMKGSYVGWTMPQALALSNGGILRGTTIMAGEGGPEMYLPLDSRGAKFLNDLLSKYQANGEVRQARTAGYSVVHNVNASTTVHDSSVHTGTVTVVSGDPDDMARKLRAKARQSALASKV